MGKKSDFCPLTTTTRLLLPWDRFLVMRYSLPLTPMSHSLSNRPSLQLEPAAGERPPRALGLDLSLLSKHACCMPGAMRDWILPPRGGGPIRLSCWSVYIASHGEAASPGAGRAVCPIIP